MAVLFPCNPSVLCTSREVFLGTNCHVLPADVRESSHSCHIITRCWWSGVNGLCWCYETSPRFVAFLFTYYF